MLTISHASSMSEFSDVKIADRICVKSIKYSRPISILWSYPSSGTHQQIIKHRTLSTVLPETQIHYFSNLLPITKQQKVISWETLDTQPSLVVVTTPMDNILMPHFKLHAAERHVAKRQGTNSTVDCDWSDRYHPDDHHAAQSHTAKRNRSYSTVTRDQYDCLHLDSSDRSPCSKKSHSKKKTSDRHQIRL